MWSWIQKFDEYIQAAMLLAVWILMTAMSPGTLYIVHGLYILNIIHKKN